MREARLCRLAQDVRQPLKPRRPLDAPDVREQVCSDMDILGVKIDTVANAGIHGKLQKISRSDSKVEVWVVPTNEELLIARDTLALISK